MADDFATGYALGSDSGGNRNNCGLFSGEWIWAFLIIALLFGDRWGNNNGGQNAMPMMMPYALGGFNASSTDTRAAISDGFALNDLQRGVGSIQSGLCDGFYAMNTSLLNGFNGVNTAMLQGFNSSNVAMLQAQNALQAQLSNCCCETREAIQGVNYNMATNTCAIQNTLNSNTRDIIDSQQAGTRAILDYLCQDKIATLQAENQALRLSASQDRQNALLTTAMSAQTQQIVNTLRDPAPVPAYPVNNPNTPYSGGCNSGCSF